MKTIIIEDEAVAARALETMIGELSPDLNIVAVLQSVEETVEWMHENDMPDVIFMDIHLADGSSFSIFDEAEITCPVIFTTAYDEYALKAFEVNSIDYLLKPINKKELERALGKFRNMYASGGSVDTNDAIARMIAEIKAGKPSYKSFFLIHERDKFIPLSIRDIACVYIDAKVVTIVTADGKRRNIDQPLDEIMEQLNPYEFYRANRQCIISRSAIKDITMWFGNKLVVNLSVDTPERVYISKARVREFKKWLTE